MLIAVVSDTHRDSYSIGEVLKKIGKADLLIHLGDNVRDAVQMSSKFKGRTIYVKGNCDYAPSVPSELVEDIAGRRFFITHGHNYGVKQSLSLLCKKAKAEGAHVALYGHTHISSIVKEGGIYCINPGSASEGRDGCESIVMIEIKDDSIKPWLEVV